MPDNRAVIKRNKARAIIEPVVAVAPAPLHTILNGDCLALLRQMPSNSVHCIVTSPPYFGLRDYGVSGQIGLEASVREHIAVMVEVFEECRRVLRSDGTLWLNYGDAYASSINGRSAADTKATGKDDRTFRDKPTDTVKASGLKPKDLMGLPWRVAFALQDAGWYLRSDIVWRKPNPMPESCRDRPTRAHEYVFLFTKSQRYFYDADAIRTPVKNSRRRLQTTFDANASMVGANARDVWDIATEPFGAEFCTACRTYFDGAEKSLIRLERNGDKTTRVCTCGESTAWLSHFATFPTELARRCIAAGSPTHACSECAKPWKRDTKRAFVAQADVSTAKNARTQRQHDSMSRRAGSARGTPEVATIGFSPTCSCSSSAAPAMVLDPFGGAGTVSVVATSLGRKSTLCELNPDYVALAEQRIARGTRAKPSAKAVRERKRRESMGPDLVDLMATGKPVTPTPTPPRTKAVRSNKQAGHGRRRAEITRIKSSVAAPVAEPPTINLEDYLATLPPERPTPTERVRAEKATRKGRGR